MDQGLDCRLSYLHECIRYTFTEILDAEQADQREGCRRSDPGERLRYPCLHIRILVTESRRQYIDGIPPELYNIPPALQGDPCAVVAGLAHASGIHHGNNDYFDSL